MYSLEQKVIRLDRQLHKTWILKDMRWYFIPDSVIVIMDSLRTIVNQKYVISEKFKSSVEIYLYIQVSNNLAY